jgi:hypothetical protein
VRRLAQFLILAAVAAGGCGQKPTSVSDFAAERQRMVQQQLKPRGINDDRVLAAMAKVPREEFIPVDARADAYEDGPLPIGYGQTISQLYIVAFMTEQLRPKPSDRVLEIGRLPELPPRACARTRERRNPATKVDWQHRGRRVLTIPKD